LKWWRCSSVGRARLAIERFAVNLAIDSSILGIDTKCYLYLGVSRLDERCIQNSVMSFSRREKQSLTSGLKRKKPNITHFVLLKLVWMKYLLALVFPESNK